MAPVSQASRTLRLDFGVRIPNEPSTYMLNVGIQVILVCVSISRIAAQDPLIQSEPQNPKFVHSLCSRTRRGLKQAVQTLNPEPLNLKEWYASATSQHAHLLREAWFWVVA